MRTIRSLTAIGLMTVLAAGSALAGQPIMQEALGHLREAREALVRAEHNKGGHRERALRHVDAAIREVEAGIAYAR